MLWDLNNLIRTFDFLSFYKEITMPLDLPKLSPVTILIMETAALRRYFDGTGAVVNGVFEDIKYVPYSEGGPYEIYLRLRNHEGLDKIVPDLQKMYKSKLVFEWVDDPKN